MRCSVFALITFCKQPTLSGITFGLNIISTAFLSPVLVVANSSASAENGNAVYWFSYCINADCICVIHYIQKEIMALFVWC